MSLGIYYHIPFCRTKCNYCHFVTRPWGEGIAERYCNAIIREMELFFERHPCDETVDTIYFGGGTPSLVPAAHIERLLETCSRFLPVADDCEISLESNPETLSADKIRAYMKMGVNRVSVGAQTFDAGGLRAIGRGHDATVLVDALDMLREQGLDNVNLDLMLGLPGQSALQWNADLERVAHFLPSHVSVYMLDLDANAPLYHTLRRGLCRIPEDDLVADLYLNALEHLADLGYAQYEISNFALPGRESRHNLKYWLRQKVFGFGVGSHSFDGGARYANHSRMSKYLSCLEEDELPTEWHECLPRSQALQEVLFLGLRLNQGVDWGRVRGSYDSVELAAHEASLLEMSDRGLLEWSDSLVRLTRRGMLLSNEVFQAFV